MQRETRLNVEPPDLLGLLPKSSTRSSSAAMVLQAVGLAGTSPACAALAAAVAEAATDAAGVVVVGETGAGHQLVAQALHLLTRASSAPFLTISCAGESTRLARQLFGDDDRTSMRAGDAHVPAPERLGNTSLIWRANHGTLFIDGIDEMPEPLQARLAHLLRDREAVVAGQERRVAIDIHVVAGARGGVEREVEAGRVRPDLFHRLAGRVALVPLRERPQDVAAIAHHWLESVCRRSGIQPKHLEHAAEVLLAALPWRGNIDELRAMIEVLVARVPGEHIRIEAVLGAIPAPETTFVTQPAPHRQMTLRDARREFERQFIGAVLAAHHGRIPEAAKALGIQRTNLYRKLRSLRISAGNPGARQTLSTRRAASTPSPERPTRLT